MGFSRALGTLLTAALLMFSFSCASTPPPSKEPAQASAGPRSVAVWNLDNLSPGSTLLPDLGETLSSKIMETLSLKPNYTVVERQKLLLALEELNIGSSSLADESTRLKLGRIVGARLMIFGGYLKAGKQVRLDLRLVDVQSGRVLKAAEKTIAASDLASMLEATAQATEELL